MATRSYGIDAHFGNLNFYDWVSVLSRALSVFVRLRRAICDPKYGMPIMGSAAELINRNELVRDLLFSFVHTIVDDSLGKLAHLVVAWTSQPLGLPSCARMLRPPFMHICCRGFTQVKSRRCLMYDVVGAFHAIFAEDTQSSIFSQNNYTYAEQNIFAYVKVGGV